MIKLALPIVVILVVAVFAIHLQQQQTGAITVSFVQPSKTVAAGCTNGQMRCNGNQIMQCRDHEWKVMKKCGVNEYCDPRNWKCLTVTKALRKGSLWSVKPERTDCSPVYRPYNGYEKIPGCPLGMNR